MSIKDLLSNQFRYPLPAPPPYFTHVHDTNSMISSINSQYVNVTGMPNPTPFGITDPFVQISMISTGFQNTEVQMCGYSNYNPSAGTLEILVNNCSNATSRFLIFVSQSTDV